MKIVRESLGFVEDSDPITDMGIGLEHQMKEKLKDFEVMDLINYLDAIPAIFKKYRDKKATYDDGFYKDMPLEVLYKLGIKSYMLDKIIHNTDSYDGWLDYDLNLNTVTMGGGD
jgi:hypothetical protein